MSRALVPALFATLALVGCNVEPTTLSVAIGPINATSGDTLRVEFLSQARDVNGDPITYEYAWAVDGTARTEFTTAEIPAEATQKGQTWTVSVTPNDGKKDGDPATAEVVVGNSLPTANISAPETALKSTFDLQATASGTDVDGDEVVIQWYWTVDDEGTPVDGPTVSAAFTRPGQIWTAHAVPFDGEDHGVPATIEIQVLNGEPVVDGITLDPEEPFTDTSIVATVLASDPDRQEVELTYTWTVDGREVMSGVDRTTLPSTSFEKHQVVEVTVVPNDGVADGTPASASVTVLNTPPTTPEIAIVPEEPIPDIDDMRCTVAMPSIDTDGDPISYRVEWTVDGVYFGGGTTTDIEGDTIPSDSFFDDEVWTCTIVPADDDVDGIGAEVTVVPVTWSGPRVFTTCDKSGNKGPKQSDCDSSSGYLNTDLEGEVTVTDGIQHWTVPVDGDYRISARGGQGAASSGSPYKYSGGEGAIVRGDFRLYRGDVIKVAVGHEGKTDGYSAGGGGGSWVADSSGKVMMVAGGGGATGYYGSYYGRRDGCDALSVVYGGRGSTDSYSSVPSYACDSKGTSAGLGGTVPGYYSGNGGAGMNGDGANDPYSYYGGTGGKAWVNGAEGGAGAAAGGFGGGGGGNGSYASGGGGGYSGGDAGRTISGGGGSYNTGDNGSITIGNLGHGEVQIDFLGF